MSDLAFLDTETTHLNSAIGEIIEICIIRETESGAQRINTWKIKPLHIHTAHPQSLKLNGYNDKEWIDALSPDIAAIQIAQFLSGCKIVAHNARFDLDHLEELLHKYQVSRTYSHRYICTMTLAHEHLYFLRSISLSSIRKFFGWGTDGEHRAEKDCLDLQKLYHKLNKASSFDRFWWQFRKKMRVFFGIDK
jgi:ATP-dependent DNA helicase DinG